MPEEWDWSFFFPLYNGHFSHWPNSYILRFLLEYWLLPGRVAFQPMSIEYSFCCGHWDTLIASVVIFITSFAFVHGWICTFQTKACSSLAHRSRLLPARCDGWTLLFALAYNWMNRWTWHLKASKKLLMFLSELLHSGGLETKSVS